jgi:Flp pilus assembly protein TadB
MKKKGGYVGLVVILVATAILALLYARTYFSPTKTQTITPEGAVETTTTQTRMEANQKTLDSARMMQEKLNHQNQGINEALGE